MTLMRMSIISIMIFLWTILVGVFLYYHKMAIDCKTNPAIKCWKDWKCFDPAAVKGTLPQGLTYTASNIPGVEGTLNSNGVIIPSSEYTNLKNSPILAPVSTLTSMYTQSKNGNYVLLIGTPSSNDAAVPIKNWDNDPKVNAYDSFSTPDGTTYCCVISSDKKSCVTPAPQGTQNKTEACKILPEILSSS